MLFESFAVYTAWGLLALRLSLATVFLAHGTMKLGTWKMQPSAQMPAGMLNMMKFLSIAELAGGLGLLVGLLSQLAAVGLAIIMLGAIYMKVTKWHSPFASTEKNGWEFDVVLLAGCVMLFVAGPGMLALDLMLK